MVQTASSSPMRRGPSWVPPLAAFVVAFVVVFVVAVPVAAWGEYGHEVVANVAWHRLSAEARASVSALLNVTNSTLVDEAGSPLAAVANWADQVRHYKPWSSGLHYIDVRDDAVTGGCHYRPGGSGGGGIGGGVGRRRNTAARDDHRSTAPPTPTAGACDFDYERDCPDDYCVAGAIMNYSSQLLRSGVGRFVSAAPDATTGRRPSLRRPGRRHGGGDSGVDGVEPSSPREALMFLIQ